VKQLLIKEKQKNLVENYWNEWLAGLIDGNGSLIVSKAGDCSCEITMGIADEKTLLLIKQKLGGSVKLRSGVQAVRYRLHHIEGIKDLVNRINGNIRTKSRSVQLEAMCLKLNIILRSPESLNLTNYWFMGYFDAEGCITANFNCFENKPLSKLITRGITISISSKLKENLEPFKLLSGNIYYDKSNYGRYIWAVTWPSNTVKCYFESSYMLETYFILNFES